MKFNIKKKRKTGTGYIVYIALKLEIDSEVHKVFVKIVHTITIL